MSMTGRWLVRLSIDAQRARNLTLPDHADSPVIMYTLLNLAATLTKWAHWEGTPVVEPLPVHRRDRQAGTDGTGSFLHAGLRLPGQARRRPSWTRRGESEHEE